MEKAVPGQRWVSDAEPELGLGIILKAEFGRVEIYFPASTEHRQYALDSAPLRRVRFKSGDHIQTHEGVEQVIDEVEENDGILAYRSGDEIIGEAELSDSISFSKPEDRLFGGQIDNLDTFDLRVESLYRRCEIRRSAVRGFVGGRVDLIPHQLYIAGEVASRLVPRVLLADEVGLGKTIEACLILHRLHLTGRADRILILVPEPLIHQWFVELLRRFNFLFNLFDDERCDSIDPEGSESGINPFLDSQLVLCGTTLLSENTHRARQAVEAGWDLVVVDEAHHMEWPPEVVSTEYKVVEELSRDTVGLLLLTATPRQLGPEGHFARLRLLDPDRYTDLTDFMEETEHYEDVAHAVDRLLDGQPLDDADRELFGSRSHRIRNYCDKLSAGDEEARKGLIAELLDAFGTGRVIFRNTRAVLSGYPERRPHLVPLQIAEQEDEIDARITWLVDWLQGSNGQKALLICKSRELVEEISTRLQNKIQVNCALFHENLTLLQRDRNAAYFAEEEGAQILLCSEIGSEGRNFQFAHHLVLFDLPDDPGLLEQRIGRLDRIGQTEVIHIYVPYIGKAESEVMARWYHEGLQAFEKNVHGADEIKKELALELKTLKAAYDPDGMDVLIEHAKMCRHRVTEKLARGQDRLLELNSCKPELAQDTIADIERSDKDLKSEDYVIRLFDHFGLQVDELGGRQYHLHPYNLTTDAFPDLPDEGLVVTFDRKRALSREDIGFLSPDHPMLRSAIELLLGSETGNTAFGVWENPGPEAIFLEIYAVVECVAPAILHVDRFLPSTPIRIVVDHSLNDQSQNAELRKLNLKRANIHRLLGKPVVKRKLLPQMLEEAEKLASVEMHTIIKTAHNKMDRQMTDEIDRLVDLKEINDHVRPEEITALLDQKTALIKAIKTAHLRLDSVRLIWRRSQARP